MAEDSNPARREPALTSMEVGEGEWRERDHILSGETDSSLLPATNNRAEGLAVREEGLRPLVKLLSRVVEVNSIEHKLRSLEHAKHKLLPFHFLRDLKERSLSQPFLSSSSVCLRPISGEGEASAYQTDSLGSGAERDGFPIGFRDEYGKSESKSQRTSSATSFAIDGTSRSAASAVEAVDGRAKANKNHVCI